jgi:hypothetical protein
LNVRELLLLWLLLARLQVLLLPAFVLAQAAVASPVLGGELVLLLGPILKVFQASIAVASVARGTGIRRGRNLLPDLALLLNIILEILPRVLGLAVRGRRPEVDVLVGLRRI